MNTSVMLATTIACCLIGGMSTAAWGEDLESALENVTISTEAQNTATNNSDADNQPCTKASGANCPAGGDDNNVNTNAYQATTLQQAILNGHEANVTVNGAVAPQGPQANISISGF